MCGTVEEFITVEIDEYASVVGAEWSVIKSKKACSMETVNDARGTGDEVYLRRAIDGGVRRDFTVEDSMSVEEIIFVEEGLPRCIGASERSVGINH